MTHQCAMHAKFSGNADAMLNMLAGALAPRMKPSDSGGLAMPARAGTKRDGCVTWS